MEGRATALAGAVSVKRGSGSGLMDAMEIDFHTTPFRAERFLELYEPAVSRVLAFGAKGYVFYRSEDDPDHFIHLSFWEDRTDFDRYWLSEEMREVRRRVGGLYGQPVLPHWSVVLDQS
jgi:quinol monooxygenase YgiN